MQTVATPKQATRTVALVHWSMTRPVTTSSAANSVVVPCHT
jgi:hypothetical protein